MRRLMTAMLFVIALYIAIRSGLRARDWNDQLGLVSPFAQVEPIVTDPHTPRLTDRVVLDRRSTGSASTNRTCRFSTSCARAASRRSREVPYPTISRPNYVTILTGVPPADSGVRANRVRIAGRGRQRDGSRAGGRICASRPRATSA